MDLFGFLKGLAQERHLPFVVIGGHAVNALGYSRLTLDLDLLIRREQRQDWLSALGEIGYAPFRQTDAFVQLEPPLKDMWPIDLMLVNERTFSGIMAEASEHDFGTVQLKVPSLEHVVALKLHALKQDLPLREAKDFGDLTHLVVCNRLDVHSAKFRELVEKYGTTAIYERLLRTVPGSRSAGQ